MILLLEARMTLWRAEQQKSSSSSSAVSPVAPFRFLRGRSPHRLFNLSDEPLRAGHHPLVFYAAMAGISQIAYLALYLAGFRYYAGSGTVSFLLFFLSFFPRRSVSSSQGFRSDGRLANSGHSRSGSCAPRQSRSKRRSIRQRPLGWATLDSPHGSGTGTSPRRSKRRRMTPSRCVMVKGGPLRLLTRSFRPWAAAACHLSRDQRDVCHHAFPPLPLTPQR